MDGEGLRVHIDSLYREAAVNYLTNDGEDWSNFLKTWSYCNRGDRTEFVFITHKFPPESLFEFKMRFL
jgi:hypothetical protein